MEFKVDDYVKLKRRHGTKIYGDGRVEPVFRTYYTTIREVQGELYVFTMKVSSLTSEEIMLSKRKEPRISRWVREPLLEATFDVTKDLKFDMTIAKRFNTQFCKDFNLKKSRIKIVERCGRGLIGVHYYRHHLIEIKSSLNDKQRWETYFHELAHYRERRHDAVFHEEMGMIYKRFAKWIEEKEILVAADKEKK